MLFLSILNLAGQEKTAVIDGRSFELSYGRAYYVPTKLPLDFNIDEFREHCRKLIPLMKWKDHINGLKVGFFRWNLAKLNCYYFIPDRKNIKKNEKVPLVVFLHGVGEGGNSKDILFRHPQTLVFIDPENQKKYPCYFLAPQIAPWPDHSSHWLNCKNSNPRHTPPALMSVLKMIKNMLKVFPDIDRQRIYITGLSSGGQGAWDAISRNPGIFAGAVPISGFCSNDTLKTKQQVGVWSFWNANEGRGNRIAAMKSLKKAASLGYDARYTMFHPDYKQRFKGHFAWEWAYAEPDLIPWLFAHKLDKKDIIEIPNPPEKRKR